MKQSFGRISTPFAVLALALAFSTPTLAAQSALVGKLKQDGTIQIFPNRFQDNFADGTPVAKIETTRTDGIVRIHRRSAEGCHVESTQLEIAAATSPDGSHALWEVNSHPISLIRCEDNGCADEFTYGAWTAACGDFGSVEPYIIKCVCIRKNFDQVIGQAGDYCQQRFWSISIWDLRDWILPQFVE